MQDIVPKLCGADIELGNFISGVAREGGTGREASHRLLQEIDGLPYDPAFKSRVAAFSYADPSEEESGKWTSVGSAYAGEQPLSKQAVFDPQDWGRRFLVTNGGCAYIDLNHLEICLPEVLSARDHVAGWHAMLRIVRRAQVAANEKLPEGRRIEVLANNSDGLGNSYGSHLNFLVSRRTWNNLFNRRIHYALYLAAYQASSIIFAGQGKVGSENDAPPVDYQISQRADFFEVLCGLQTTYRRPILNTRDEPHCGSFANGACPRPYARLHVIFYDSTLSHVASLLKIGAMQIVLSMIEAGRVNNGLMLEDPLPAVLRWSHDPSLQLRLPTVDGTSNTAAELQLRFLDDAAAFVGAGGCDGIVPDADRVLSLWADTVEKLHRRDYAALSSRLDWVLKRGVLQRAMDREPSLTWQSPAIRMLDFLYSSLDPTKGLYWAYERSGAIERVVSEERVQHLEQQPPEDTRAWTRAMLLRRASPHHVRSVDWDSVTLVDPRVERLYANTQSLTFPDPLRHTKAEMSELFSAAPCLEDVLDALERLDASANRSAASL